MTKSLPISSSTLVADQLKKPGLRRRLSMSNIATIPAATWAMQSSKSLSTMGDNVKKWWEICWGWIMSRKPTFVQDLEMNEEEKHLLGFQCKGSLRHVLFKVKKLFRFNDDLSLPQTFRYNNNHYYGYSRGTTLG